MFVRQPWPSVIGEGRWICSALAARRSSVQGCKLIAAWRRRVELLRIGRHASERVNGLRAVRCAHQWADFYRAVSSAKVRLSGRVLDLWRLRAQSERKLRGQVRSFQRRPLRSCLRLLAQRVSQRHQRRNQLTRNGETWVKIASSRQRLRSLALWASWASEHKGQRLDQQEVWPCWRVVALVGGVAQWSSWASWRRWHQQQEATAVACLRDQKLTRSLQCWRASVRLCKVSTEPNCSAISSEQDDEKSGSSRRFPQNLLADPGKADSAMMSPRRRKSEALLCRDLQSKLEKRRPSVHQPMVTPRLIARESPASFLRRSLILPAPVEDGLSLSTTGFGCPASLPSTSALPSPIQSKMTSRCSSESRPPQEHRPQNKKASRCSSESRLLLEQRPRASSRKPRKKTSPDCSSDGHLSLVRRPRAVSRNPASAEAFSTLAWRRESRSDSQTRKWRATSAPPTVVDWCAVRCTAWVPSQNPSEVDLSTELGEDQKHGEAKQFWKGLLSSSPSPTASPQTQSPCGEQSLSGYRASRSQSPAHFRTQPPHRPRSPSPSTPRDRPKVSAHVTSPPTVPLVLPGTSLDALAQADVRTRAQKCWRLLVTSVFVRGRSVMPCPRLLFTLWRRVILRNTLATLRWCSIATLGRAQRQVQLLRLRVPYHAWRLEAQHTAQDRAERLLCVVESKGLEILSLAFEGWVGCFERVSSLDAALSLPSPVDVEFLLCVFTGWVVLCQRLRAKLRRRRAASSGQGTPCSQLLSSERSFCQTPEHAREFPPWALEVARPISEPRSLPPSTSCASSSRGTVQALPWGASMAEVPVVLAKRGATPTVRERLTADTLPWRGSC